MVGQFWFCSRKRTGHIYFDGSKLQHLKNQFSLHILEIGNQLHFLFWNDGRKDQNLYYGKHSNKYNVTYVTRRVTQNITHVPGLHFNSYILMVTFCVTRRVTWVTFLFVLLCLFIFTLSKIIKKTRDDTCGLLQP